MAAAISSPCNTAAAARTPGSVSEIPVEEVTLLHSLRRKHRTAPHRQQPAVAAGGQFFLARPLFRTRRRHGAPAAERAAALQSRTHERLDAVVAPLLTTLESQGQLPGISEKPELRQNAEAFEAELLAAIFDPSRPGSLQSIVGQPPSARRCTCATAPRTTCGASSASSTSASPRRRPIA